MHRARDKLFACACFARDKQGRVRPRHALDETKDATHRWALTDHVIEVHGRRHARAQTSHFIAQEVKLRRTLNTQCELLHLERLGEKIIAPARISAMAMSISPNASQNDRHIGRWTRLGQSSSPLMPPCARRRRCVESSLDASSALCVCAPR